jgi:hypothetical protein
MPYANFDDNNATKDVYSQQQQQDPDLNICEFIFEKLLCIGQIFDSDDDEDEIPQDLPLKNQQPLQAIQIQSGFMDCAKAAIKIQEFPSVEEKPTCIFREKMFSADFHAAVFHPPAIGC